MRPFEGTIRRFTLVMLILSLCAPLGQTAALAKAIDVSVPEPSIEAQGAATPVASAPADTDGEGEPDNDAIPTSTALPTEEPTTNGENRSLAPAASGVTLSVDGPTTLSPDGVITYILTISNMGPDTATDVAFYADPADGMRWYYWSNLSLAPGLSLGSGNSARTGIPTIPSGTSYLFEIAYEVATSACGDLVIDFYLEQEGSSALADTVTTSTGNPCTPAMSFEMSADVTSVDTIGDLITYTFTLGNTGYVPLTTPTVVSELEGLSALDCNASPGIQPLPAQIGLGTTVSCTATYAVTAQDFNAAGVDHSVTADSTETEPIERSVYVEAIQDPGLTLTTSATAVNGQPVSASPVTGLKAGDVVTFTMTTTNTGNVWLWNNRITVGDTISLDTPLTCRVNDQGDSFAADAGATLTPQDTLVCRSTYTLTQSDIDAQQPLTITAQAAGEDNTSNPFTSADDETVYPIASSPAIALTQSVTAVNGQAVSSGNVEAYEGDVVTYSLTATNTGNVTLENVQIAEEDDTLDQNLDCAPTNGSILAPEASITCTVDYTITSADGDAGSATNNASVTGAHGQTTVDDDASATVTVVRANLAYIVTSSPPTSVAPGGALYWLINIANSGTGDANDVIVNVTLPDGFMLGEDGLSDGCVLTSGTSEAQCIVDVPRNTPMHTPVTLSFYGMVDDTGEVCGPITANVTGDDLSAAPTVSIDCQPGITASKTTTGYTDANENGRPDAGETVSWEITVTNTGNIPLTGIEVTDTVTDAEGAFTWISPEGFDGTIAAPLAPEGTITLQATYALTQDDIDVGEVENCVSVTAFDGDLAEPNDALSDNCATFTVTQLAALTLTNTATAVNDEAVTSWPVTGLQAGDVVTFTMTATNTGNVSTDDTRIFTDTGINDTDLVCRRGDADDTWGNDRGARLIPDERLVCVSTYTVTQADVDAQQELTLSAEVRSSAAGTALVTASDDETIYPEISGPAIDLAITATQVNGEDVDGPVTDLLVNDVVTYTLTATNVGNVTLQDVTAAFDLPLQCDPEDGAPLGPDATITCTVDYTITQDDVDAGSVTNVASVTGTYGEDYVSDDATETVTTLQIGSLALEKLVDGEAEITVSAPTDVTWQFVVSNSGTVTLVDITILDEMVDAKAIDCDPEADGYQTTIPTLAPGESGTCEVAFSVTQDAIDAGNDIVNTASAQASTTEPSVDLLASAQPVVLADVVASAPGSATIRINQAAALTVEQSATPTENLVPGDVITFTFTATNSGNVTLNDVILTTTLAGLVWDEAAPDGAIGDLAPGERVAVTATYTVTEDDIAAGSISNTLTAVAANAESDPSVLTLTVAAPATPPATPPAEESEPTMTATPSASTTPVTITELPKTGGAETGHRHAGAWTLLSASALTLLAVGLGVRRNAHR